VVLRILAGLVEAFVLILVARAILSWVPLRPGSPLVPVVRVLDAITEPVLRPVRKVVRPVRAGGVGIDLSVMIVILVAEIIVVPLLRS